MLDIDSTLFIQIVNFLVLVILLRVFAYKPVVKILAERKAKIAASIEAAENDEARAKTMLEECRKREAEARIKAQEIVAKAEKQVQESRDAQLALVKKEIDELRKNAEAEITREKLKAMKEMRDEVARMSVEISSKFLAKNIDKEANDKLVDEVISKLDKDKLGDLPC